MKKPSSASGMTPHRNALLSLKSKARPQPASKDSVPESITMKCLRRYGNPFDQLDAEQEFLLRERECRTYLDSLTNEIAEGGINALRELILIAHDAAKVLQRISEAEPHLVAAFAENYSAWPVLWTGGSFSKAQKALLDEIHLGVGKPDTIGRRVIGQDPPLSRRWAILLLNAIVAVRRLHGVRESRRPYFWALKRSIMELEIPTEPALESRKGVDYLKPRRIEIWSLLEADPEISGLAKELPHFMGATADLWWVVAERLLKQITIPGLENFPGLQRLARTSKVQSLTKSTKTQIQELIKYIKPVFLKLASY